MGIYSKLVGKRVQVQYRAADIHLSANGTLVSDSGTSIVLEDHITEGEKGKTIRVEIPYQSKKKPCTAGPRLTYKISKFKAVRSPANLSASIHLIRRSTRSDSLGVLRQNCGERAGIFGLHLWRLE